MNWTHNAELSTKGVRLEITLHVVQGSSLVFDLPLWLPRLTIA